MKKTLLAISLIYCLSSTISAQPVVNEHESDYQISGNTADQLRAEMKALGPMTSSGRFDAKTDWFIHWHYNWHYDNPSQNPCYVTSVSVSADITHFMPQWINKSAGTPELQDKWNTFITNLTTHEHGHDINGRQAANDIEKALMSTPAQSNCSALQAALERNAKNLVAQHNDWDVKYDVDTQHGKTQGAVFP